MYRNGPYDAKNKLGSLTQNPVTFGACVTDVGDKQISSPYRQTIHQCRTFMITVCSLIVAVIIQEKQLRNTYFIRLSRCDASINSL